MAKIASYGTPTDIRSLTKLGLIDTGYLSAELEPERMTYKDLVSLSHMKSVEAHLRKVASVLRAQIPELPPTIPDSALTAAAYYLLRPNGEAGPILRDMRLINVLRPKTDTLQLLSPRTTNTVKIRVNIDDDLDGGTSVDFLNKDGELHRVDGPAHRSWRSTGMRYAETWAIEGKRHRLGGPADRLWRIDGTLANEEWLEHGVTHRVGGPAATLFERVGRPSHRIEMWYLHGKFQKKTKTQVQVSSV